jgi:hypothetical protein
MDAVFRRKYDAQSVSRIGAALLLVHATGSPNVERAGGLVMNAHEQPPPETASATQAARTRVPIVFLRGGSCLSPWYSMEGRKADDVTVSRRPGPVGRACARASQRLSLGMDSGTSTTETDDLPIQHEQSGDAGVFYVEVGGERLAELGYRRSAGRANIEHTNVSERLRGRGVARRLVDAAVAWARGSGTKLSATCSYAKSVFDKDPSLRDVVR